MMKEKELLSLEQLHEVKETFSILSKNSETLEVIHLKTAMMGLGLFPTNDEIGRITTQIKILRKMKKSDDLKEITLKDFIEIVSYRIANRKIDDDCKRTFRLLAEGKNEISLNNVTGLVDHFHEKLTSKDVEEIIKAGDVNKDGAIGIDDFMEIMRHTNYY